MSKVQKHPSDEGRYQSAVATYGHGAGQGKSRSAVYKHLSSLDTITELSDEQAEHTDFVESDEPSMSSTTQNPTEFESISWLDEEESETPPTIPTPIRKLASGDPAFMSEAQRASQDILFRWGWGGIDRGLSWWGKGVMGNPEWSIERHPHDYDALTAATSNLMDKHGLSISLNAELVFAVVVSSAYAPPVAHIVRNTDGSISGRWWGRFISLVSSPLRMFRRRREPVAPQN